MTEQLNFHFSLSFIGKEMATHSSVLAWRIPGTGESGGLPSLGSQSQTRLSSSSSNMFVQGWIILNNHVSLVISFEFTSQNILSDLCENPTIYIAVRMTLRIHDTKHISLKRVHKWTISTRKDAQYHLPVGNWTPCMASFSKHCTFLHHDFYQ